LTSPGREAQTFAGETLLVRYANFVKLPHTVFALPFALLGVVVASRQTALTWRTLGLVVLAFTCARFVALGFNRIADRELDARNPRTQARELPSGRLTLRQAWAAVGVAAAVFLATAWALNPVCFALAPFALAFISAYSYGQTVHALVPPLARSRRRDRHPGGVSRRHRTVERAVVAPPGRRPRCDLLGGRVRCVLRAPG